MKKRNPRSVRAAWFSVIVTVVVLVPSVVLASHQFVDVSDANVFHDAIAWMADNGITVGCNPPASDRYCPNDYVTRAQMAAFMQRLAQKQVVDAGTLDGKDSSDFMGRGYGQVRVVGIIPSTIYWDMEFSGPHPGFISARTPNGGTTCLKPDPAVLSLDDVMGGLMQDASGNDTRLYFNGSFNCNDDEVAVWQKSNFDGSFTNQSFNIFVP